MAKRTDETFPCPVCGSDVKVGARACLECGADAETGWSDETLYDGLDLPDPGYGPEELEPRPERRSSTITAVIVLILIGLAILWRAL